MTEAEYNEKMTEIRSGIDNAKTEDEVKEFEARAKDLKAQYEAEKETQIVKRSAFDASKARKGMAMNETKTPELEAREAFRAYMEQRADAQTKLSDVVVPETVEAMLEQDKSTGQILAQTTQTAYATGYNIALANIIGDEASWVAEGSSAESEKLTQSKISFMAHKVQKKIAVSREVKAMALPEFEAQVATKAITAITKAIETAIFTGAGTASPKGITKTTGVPAQEMQALTYAGLVALVGELPEEYDGNARFYMSKKTFFKILGLVDTQGQPIARVSTGLDGRNAHSLLGYDVCFTKALKAFDTASNDDPVIVLGDMSKYVVNTVAGTVLEPYTDHSADGYVYPATALVDGKVAVNEAFVIAKKKSAGE